MNKRRQKVPYLLIWRRDINMTPPDPFAVRHGSLLFNQGNRLGVMNKHDITINLDFINISLACLHEDVKHLRRNFLRLSMKCVVEFLCGVEETLTTFNKIPSGVYPKFLQ